MKTRSWQKSDVTRYLSEFSESGLDAQGSFFALGRGSKVEHVHVMGETIPRYVNEFWTARQRQGSSISEISYRACFKPQLPRFFIQMLTQEGDTVYDPFCGRGTTVVEAGLLGRKFISNDANPLSEILTRPRLFVPDRSRIEEAPVEPSFSNEREGRPRFVHVFPPEHFIGDCEYQRIPSRREFALETKIMLTGGFAW